MYNHTIAGTCILENKGDFLLIKRPNKEGEFGDQWVFPGGKISVDEDIPQGLIRELKEEVGVTNLNGLSPVAFYKFIRKDGSSTQGITFFSRVKDRDIILDSESVTDYKWIQASGVLDFLKEKKTIYGIEVQVRNTCLILKGLTIPAEGYTITKYQELRCMMNKDYFERLASPDFNANNLTNDDWVLPNKGQYVH